MKTKQPMPAFFLFSNERRTALLAENKNVLEVIERTYVLIFRDHQSVNF